VMITNWWRGFSWLLPSTLLVTGLVLGSTWIYTRLRPGWRLRSRKRPVTLALVLYIVFAAAVTLSPGPPGWSSSLVIQPWNPAGLGSSGHIIGNVLLAFPLGVLIAAARPQTPPSKLVAAVFAGYMVVETLQYILNLGRVASSADVLFGTLGGIFGIWSMRLLGRRWPIGVVPPR
jgi:hypothetical protein